MSWSCLNMLRGLATEYFTRDLFKNRIDFRVNLIQFAFMWHRILGCRSISCCVVITSSCHRPLRAHPSLLQMTMYSRSSPFVCCGRTAASRPAATLQSSSSWISSTARSRTLRLDEIHLQCGSSLLSPMCAGRRRIKATLVSKRARLVSPRGDTGMVGTARSSNEARNTMADLCASRLLSQRGAQKRSGFAMRPRTPSVALSVHSVW